MSNVKININKDGTATVESGENTIIGKSILSKGEVIIKGKKHKIVPKNSNG